MSEDMVTIAMGNEVGYLKNIVSAYNSTDFRMKSTLFNNYFYATLCYASLPEMGKYSLDLKEARKIIQVLNKHGDIKKFENEHAEACIKHVIECSNGEYKPNLPDMLKKMKNLQDSINKVINAAKEASLFILRHSDNKSPISSLPIEIVKLIALNFHLVVEKSYASAL